MNRRCFLGSLIASVLAFLGWRVACPKKEFRLLQVWVGPWAVYYIEPGRTVHRVRRGWCKFSRAPENEEEGQEVMRCVRPPHPLPGELRLGTMITMDGARVLWRTTDEIVYTTAF